jgi:hypothetical protein
MSEMTLAKNRLIPEPDLSDISSKKFETVTSNYGICFGVVSADASHFYFQLHVFASLTNVGFLEIF